MADAEHPSSAVPWGVTAAAWLLATALGLGLAWHIVSTSDRPSNGFGAYYTASRLLIEGANTADYYDDEWFSDRVMRLCGIHDIYNLNPPSSSLLLLPLARKPYSSAKIWWTGFCTVLLILLWVGAGREMPGHQRAAMLAFLALFQPLWASFNSGQVYLPLLGLLALVWVGESRDRPAVTGLGLGLMMVFKTAGVLLPLWLLVRRRFRSLLWTGFTGVMVIVVSLPWLGTEAWMRYLLELPGLRERPWLSATAFQTHTSFFRHLLVGGYQGTPILEAPWLARALEVLVFVLLMAICVVLAARRREAAATLSCFILANLMLSPVSVSHHYVLALLPIWLLARRDGSGLEFTGLATGAILIAADLPYIGWRLYDGYWAFLAYPKLAGAACLFAVAARRAWRSPD